MRNLFRKKQKTSEGAGKKKRSKTVYFSVFLIIMGIVSFLLGLIYLADARSMWSLDQAIIGVELAVVGAFMLAYGGIFFSFSIEDKLKREIKELRTKCYKTALQLKKLEKQVKLNE